jgi:hypothetical protein
MELLETIVVRCGRPRAPDRPVPRRPVAHPARRGGRSPRRLGVPERLRPDADVRDRGARSCGHLGFGTKVCQGEYGIARIRERNEGGVLVPLYITTTKLPAYIQFLNYIDCRETDQARLRAATPKILA